MENKCPPYKETKCKACGETEESLFARTPLRDAQDFYCKPCMDAGKHT